MHKWNNQLGLGDTREFSPPLGFRTLARCLGTAVLTSI